MEISDDIAANESATKNAEAKIELKINEPDILENSIGKTINVNPVFTGPDCETCAIASLELKENTVEKIIIPAINETELLPKPINAALRAISSFFFI